MPPTPHPSGLTAQGQSYEKGEAARVKFRLSKNIALGKY